MMPLPVLELLNRPPPPPALWAEDMVRVPDPMGVTVADPGGMYTPTRRVAFSK